VGCGIYQAQKVSLFHCCSTRHVNCFLRSVVNIWISLQSLIAQAPSVATFKVRLGVFDFFRFNFLCVLFLRYG